MAFAAVAGAAAGGGSAPLTCHCGHTVRAACHEVPLFSGPEWRRLQWCLPAARQHAGTRCSVPNNAGSSSNAPIQAVIKKAQARRIGLL